VTLQHRTDALPENVEGCAIDLDRADAGQEFSGRGIGGVGEEAADGGDDKIPRATGGLQESLCEEALADPPSDQIENKLDDFCLGEHFAATLGQ
jgi:hypothetical protein